MALIPKKGKNWFLDPYPSWRIRTSSEIKSSEKEQINISRKSWNNIFYTFTLNSGMQFVHNLIHELGAIWFALDPDFIAHSHVHSTVVILCRAHSLNSLLLRSKGNVQLLTHFSEVTRTNSSKTLTALNKGTLGFVRAKCITKQRPFRYKNEQTKAAV